MAKVTITGLSELRTKLLRTIPDEAKREIQASLAKSGNEVVALAQALAPVDEGALRASIKMTTAGELTPLYGGGGQQKVGELAVRVTAGNSTVRHAAHVEFGTEKMAARPYFFPAWRTLRRRIRSRTSRAIRQAIQKAFS